MQRIDGRVDLPSQQPHSPAGHEDAAQEHCKAIEPIAHHVARCLAMGDAEDDEAKSEKTNAALK